MYRKFTYFNVLKFVCKFECSNDELHPRPTNRLNPEFHSCILHLIQDMINIFRLIQSSQVSRIRRETRAFEQFFTLTRKEKKISRIPINFCKGKPKRG